MSDLVNPFKAERERLQSRSPDIPGRVLVTFLHKFLGCRTDTELAQKLGVTAPTICKLRRAHIGVGPGFILQAHFATGIEIRALKEIAELPRLACKVPRA